MTRCIWCGDNCDDPDRGVVDYLGRFADGTRAVTCAECCLAHAQGLENWRERADEAVIVHHDCERAGPT